MIHITDAAQKHFAKLLKTQETGTQIRVSVINPGTLNAECGISYCYPKTIKSTDTKLKFDYILVYIDEFSMPYLQGTKIDLITDNLGSQLTLNAPNIKENKINKNTPLIDRVKYVLEYQINPKIANHGGQVTLIEITEDLLAILQFSGGCNGCKMVSLTLKEGIEKQLLKYCPELKGISDLTEHQHGEHSFF